VNPALSRDHQQRAAVRADQAVLIPALPPLAQVGPAEPLELALGVPVKGELLQQRQVIFADGPQLQLIVHVSHALQRATAIGCHNPVGCLVS
jgi:hypothetical protein